MERINILSASDSWISQNEYLSQVKRMILESQALDPTIVLHSDEEILKRFSNSLVALSNWAIIWNSSIYPTHISPLDSINIGWRVLNIWECWSTIVDRRFRWSWLWKKLVIEWSNTFGKKYEALAWSNSKWCDV